jgi:hypothetical protein
MIKEFKINDILNAVDEISKIEVQNIQIEIKKKNNINRDKSTHSNQAEVLVLDQMIE